MSIWSDIFGADPAVVRARQEGRTARAQARQEGRSARLQTRRSDESEAMEAYKLIHGSASEAGSGILGMFGIEAESQAERDRALAALQNAGVIPPPPAASSSLPPWALPAAAAALALAFAMRK